MSQKKTLNRRHFINSILATGTVAGLITQVHADPKPPPVGNKIKMLTADGKLVEVDQSVLEKIAGSKKATDQEVYDWMDPKHKT